MNLIPSVSTDLVPGRYTRTGFEPPITFAVEGLDWYAVHVDPGFFDVQQGVGSSDLIAVQFAKPDALYGAGGAAVPLTESSAAVDVLRQNADLRVVETSDSRIGGLTGSQVTIEAAGNETPVMRLPRGSLAIPSDRRFWMAFFDTPSGVLAIMVDGSAANWDAALAVAEPVLESVEIGG